jgi:hypothetical protein
VTRRRRGARHRRQGCGGDQPRRNKSKQLHGSPFPAIPLPARNAAAAKSLRQPNVFATTSATPACTALTWASLSPGASR